MQLDLSGDLADYEAQVAKGSFEPSDSFETSFLDREDGRSVMVTKSLLLKTSLYTVDYALSQDDEYHNNWLQCSFHNHITYRAQPSQSFHSWFGLDLSTETAGKFDFEELTRSYLDGYSLDQEDDDPGRPGYYGPPE